MRVGPRADGEFVDVDVVSTDVVDQFDDDERGAGPSTVDDDRRPCLDGAAAQGTAARPESTTCWPRLSLEREGLLADLVLALAWAGRLAEVESLAAEVLDRDPDPEVAGAVRCGLVYSLTWQGRPREALRNAQLLAPDAVAGRYAPLLQAEAAVATLFSFDLAGAGRLGGEAARAAEAGGDDVALCHALAASSWATLFGGRSDEALRVVRRLMTVADRSEDPGTTLAHPRFFPGMPLMYLDRLDEAERVLQSGRRQAQEMGLVWSLPLYHAHLGTRRFISGEWDDAVAELEAALVLGDEVGLHLPVTAAASSWLTAIHLHRGEIEAADAVVTKALRRVTETGLQLGMGLLNWARALVLDARGETEEAIGLLQTAWDLYAAGGPVTDPWTAMALVRMRTRAGQHDQARALLATIDEQAMVSGTPFMQGQALRCRGLVEEDADVLLAAVVEYRHCPRPFEVASACDDAGLLLVRSRRIAEAVPLFEEAMAIYDRLGASRESARVRAELRSHGVAHGVRAARARAAWGWESLTPTELKVVDLVVQRLSNPEVAERLFISRHTVESHLKQIYRKLAITSRIELTRLVTNRSADGDP